MKEKLRYTIPEFCALTCTSRAKAYERIRRGELTIIKDGNQSYVTHDEAERYAGASLPPAYANKNNANARAINP